MSGTETLEINELEIGMQPEQFGQIEYVEAPSMAETEARPFENKEEAEPETVKAIDPAKQLLLDRVGGKKEEDWEHVNGGKGQWVFDGEKIFNPETGEAYSGGSNAEAAALTQQEAARQWNTEGGSNHIMVPGFTEKTEHGEITHAFQIIRGETRADGLVEVGWTWHKHEVVFAKEESEDETGDNDTVSGHERFSASEEKAPEIQDTETEITSAPLEAVHGATIQQPEVAHIASHEPAVEQQFAVTVPAEIPAVVQDIALPHSIEIGASVARGELTEAFEITEGPREYGPESSFTHTMDTSGNSPLESLPVYDPSTAIVSPQESSIQAMYQALLRSPSKEHESVLQSPTEASENPTAAREEIFETATSITQQDAEPVEIQIKTESDVAAVAQHEIVVVSERVETTIGSTSEGKAAMHVESSERTREQVETSSSRIEPTVQDPKAPQEVRDISALLRTTEGAIRVGEARTIDRVDKPIALAEKETLGRDPERDQVYSTSQPIISRSLGISVFGPASVGTSGFRPSDTNQDDMQRQFSIPARELHGVRMVRVTQ